MARSFDDASSQYLINNTALLTSRPVSMACWFNNDEATPDTFQSLMIICDEATTTNYFWLLLEENASGKQLRAQEAAGGSAGLATSASSYGTNTWEHAGAVFAGQAERYVYLNGVQASDTTDIGGLPSGLDNTAIGTIKDSGGPHFYMSGLVAEAAIWNAALTQADFTMLSKGFSPLWVKPQNLVEYWRLIRDEDTGLIGGNAMTPTNSPTVGNHPPVTIYPLLNNYQMPFTRTLSGEATMAGVGSLVAVGSAFTSVELSFAPRDTALTIRQRDTALSSKPRDTALVIRKR